MPSVPAQLEGFLVVFMRVGAILLTAPLFGSRVLPPPLKIGLTALVSLLLVPVVQVRGGGFLPGTLPWALAVGGEVLLGITIGLMVRFLFAAVSMAGEFMGIEVGLSAQGLFNPDFDAQSSVLQSLAELFTLMVFLSTDAHHLLLRALAHSFSVVPPLSWKLSGAGVEAMVQLTAELWHVALRIGAPLVAAQFLAKVILALLARAAPQMNVFMVGFPFQIGIGLLTLAIMLPVMATAIEELFGQLGTRTVGMLNLLKGK
jgi:flagellar biosynthetic protein FliR